MSKKNLIQVQTVDILRGLVESLARTITITEATEPTPGKFLLKFDEILWLTPVCKYEIVGSTYVVESVESCNEVLFVGDTGSETIPEAGDTIDLAAPFFWNGTVQLTAIEWDKIGDEFKVFPAVYAMEPISDNFDNDPVASILDRTSTIKMFVVTTANFSDWFTDEHYLKAINPMRQICQELLESFEAPGSGIGEILSFTLTNHANLGVTSANKGHTSKLTSEYLSGVEFDISLPIETDLACKYFCN